MASLQIDHRGSVVEALFGDGGKNLFAFDDCLRLIQLLREPPEGSHLLRLRARGDNFCLGRDPFPPSPHERRAAVRTLVGVHEALAATDLVVVAEVQGPAAGFGVGLLALSDAAIAAPEATFRFPEADEGFAPTVVLSWLPRLVGERRAFDLAATAREFDAAEAARLGVVTIVASSRASLPEAVDAYVAALSRVPARVHRDIKTFLRATRDLTRSQAFELATDRLVFGTLAAGDDSP